MPGANGLYVGRSRASVRGGYSSPYLLEILHSGTFASQIATGSLKANTGQAVTCSRAASAYCQKADGTLTLLGPNTVRVEPNGLLVEGPSTNSALQSRDLSQAAWTKTSATVTLTATGKDGATNAASVVTATGANGTVSQAITLASAATTFSLYVRRRTGSGTVLISLDGGTTTTDVTSQLGASYVRAQATQTLANPTLWLRLATSGDAVDVDLVQCEQQPFATSPIATTTVAVTRDADIVTASGPNAVTTPRWGAKVAPVGPWSQQNFRLLSWGLSGGSEVIPTQTFGAFSNAVNNSSGIGTSSPGTALSGSTTYLLSGFLSGGGSVIGYVNGISDGGTALSGSFTGTTTTFTLGSLRGIAGWPVAAWFTDVFLDNK